VERLPDEMVEGHAFGHQVAPGLSLLELDVVFVAGAVDGLALDEGDVARPAAGVRVRAGVARVRVTGQPRAGDCLDLITVLHGRAADRGDEDGDDSA